MRFAIGLAVVLGAVACSDGSSPDASTDQAPLGAAAAVPVRTLLTLPTTLVSHIELGPATLYASYFVSGPRGELSKLAAFDLTSGAQLAEVDTNVLALAADDKGVAYWDNVQLWSTDTRLGNGTSIASEYALVSDVALDERSVYLAEFTSSTPNNAFQLRQFPRAGGAGKTLYSGFGTIYGIYPRPDSVYLLDQQFAKVADLDFPLTGSTLVAVSTSDGTARRLLSSGQIDARSTSPISSSAQGFAFADRPFAVAFDPAQSAPSSIINTPTTNVFVDPTGKVTFSYATPGCVGTKTDGRSLFCVDALDPSFPLAVSAKNGSTTRRLAVQHLSGRTVAELLGIRNNRAYFLELNAEGTALAVTFVPLN